MSKAPKIIYIYDDFTENLLNQYKQQLDHHEKIFEAKFKHLTPANYAHLRDRDDVMMAILDVIAKIYDQAIPIAINISYPEQEGNAAGPGKAGGVRH